MKYLFMYNWKIRDEWIEKFYQIPNEQLLLERTGGVGSLLKTIFHVVDAEYSWIMALMNKSVSDPIYEECNSLELVQILSNQCRSEIKEFINNWSSDLDHKKIKVPWSHNTYFYGEVLRHVIAHEIHHIGQLSVWAREIGIEPVSANLIGRKLME